MSELIEEVEEALIISDWDAKVEQLMHDLNTGTKKLSFSSIKAFRNSPRDFLDYQFRPKEQTDAMKLGVVIHCLVLEPEKFDEKYTIMDDSKKVEEIGGGNPRNTNLYKEWKANFLASAAGEVIPLKMYQQAQIISGNILNNRASAKVLSICDGISEEHIEWDYKNFKFHGYIDKSGSKAICDIKLVPDASPRKAQRTIIDMWYHGQAAMYTTGKGVRLPYYILCADRKGGVSVHKIHKSLLDHGLEEYSNIIDKFNDCLFKENFGMSYDFWAESYDGIFIVDKPAYLY